MFRLSALSVVLFTLNAGAADIDLTLRHQVETSPGSGRYHRLTRSESWKPEETAIIVCDVWDYHHCLNAVRRLEEFAPRLNEVLISARKRGVTIIHSPSSCMAAYEGHAARKRAIDTPLAKKLPPDIRAWCSRIPSEEKGVYPIDQSDGGEDDDPDEHAEWAAKLKSLGRSPRGPWKRQLATITIDDQRDYISDKGDEVWSILEHRGIKNVILTGVHTNMCVLGRPFGLRQMASNGRNAVLMRDLTDTMYNPQRWPYVSHFTGTDLIVSHIEKFVCPTITSDQFIGGEPVVLKNDTRPHVVMVIAEDEYETDKTLPEFAARHLGRDFRVSLVFGSDTERNDIPGLEAITEADVLLVSVRRRLLPEASMKLVKDYVAAGKPVVGIRTASHAFALRKGSPREGLADWPEFDAQVFGGNYKGHHGNALKSKVYTAPTAANHPLMGGKTPDVFAQAGSLYQPSPLAKGTHLLLTGVIEELPPEPVAWTFKRADGGRSFYTSLGHPGDFENPAVIRLLVNAIHWAADRSVPENIQVQTGDYRRHWTPMSVPSTWEAGSSGILRDYDGVAWYRCVIRVPENWAKQSKQDLHMATLAMQAPLAGDEIDLWMNGSKLNWSSSGGLGAIVQSEDVRAGDDNLLVIRLKFARGPRGLTTTPYLFPAGGRRESIPLKGRWQFRIGDDPAWSNMPLPAKFGGATDMYFDEVSKPEKSN